jgi:hypothetical protein
LNLLGGQGCERQAVPASVGHRQVEPAVLTFETMADEVQQREIVPAPIGVELADRLPYPVVRFTDEQRDLESRDLGIPQHRCELLRLTGGRGQSV